MRQLIFDKLPKVEIGGVLWGVGQVDETTLARAASAALHHVRAAVPVGDEDAPMEGLSAKIAEFVESVEKSTGELFVRLFALDRCKTEWQFKTAMMAINRYVDFISVCSLVDHDTFRPLGDYGQISDLRDLIQLEGKDDAIKEARESAKNAQSPSGSQEQSADGETLPSDQQIS